MIFITIEKHFPGDTSLEHKTFLNDKKVDAELYAYLQAMSYPIDGETMVKKTDLPSQTEIGQQFLNKKCRNTVGSHLKYLIDNGYITNTSDYYIINKIDDNFFKIPLDLLQYLIYAVKENVLKTYIYLGQRWKWKGSNFVFTNKDIAEHVGIDYNNNSKAVRIYLDVLERLGLITV